MVGSICLLWRIANETGISSLTDIGLLLLFRKMEPCFSFFLKSWLLFWFVLPFFLCFILKISHEKNSMPLQNGSRKEASLPSSKAHLFYFIILFFYTTGCYVFNIQQVTGIQDLHWKLNCLVNPSSSLNVVASCLRMMQVWWIIFSYEEVLYSWGSQGFFSE